MANYTSTHTGEQVDSAITEGIKSGYGVCSTPLSTVAKAATIDNSSFVLSSGAKVNIKFTYGICANATLNINSTGAKAVYYNNSAITNNIVTANQVVTLVYDGTNYILINSGANITIQDNKQSSLNVSVVNGTLSIL